MSDLPTPSPARRPAAARRKAAATAGQSTTGPSTVGKKPSTGKSPAGQSGAKKSSTKKSGTNRSAAGKAGAGKTSAGKTGAGKTGTGKTGGRQLTAYQQAKRDKRRREILDAAAEVFAEKGYFAATIQDIADRIDMRAGSLYYHLASKEEALAEVCRMSGQAFVDGAEAILAAGKPVADTIRDGIRLHLDDRWRNYVSNFAFNRGMLPDNVRPEMDAIARGYLDVWVKILTRGQKDGTLAGDIDPRTAAAALLAICNGAVSAAHDGASAEEIAERVYRLFMGGVAAG